MQQQGTFCDFPGGDSWVILSPIEQSIKRKIETVGTPLKDWDIQINYGIKTGFNDAFIITSEKRDEILANCATEDERKKTDELIRPILRGRDIKRYGYEWAKLYLIATFPARHYDIEQYPAVKQYLLSFAYDYLMESGNEWVAKGHLADFCKQKLAQTGQYVVINGKHVFDDKGNKEKGRKKTSNKWFETQDSISYWDLLCQPKIVWGEISDKTKFCIDANGAFAPEATTFMMSGKDLYLLLAFLNCPVSEYAFSKIGTTTGVGTVRWKKFKIEQLFVPSRLSEQKQRGIVNECRHLTEGYGSEESLNRLIYTVFGLSKEEIDFVENYRDSI